MVCACDGEDTWHEWPYSGTCVHGCLRYEEEELDDDDGDWGHETDHGGE